nr:hypothetical protein [Chloroflexota bacterium]
RPHFGVGMEQKPPLAVLRHLGYTGDEHIALLPPILLDPISTELLLACDKEAGNDLLATYTWELKHSLTLPLKLVDNEQYSQDNVATYVYKAGQ